MRRSKISSDKVLIAIFLHVVGADSINLPIPIVFAFIGRSAQKMK